MDIVYPYSLAFTCMTYDEIELLATRGEKPKSLEFNTGNDCSLALYNQLRNGEDKRYVLISYNGVNFDNFLLYNDLKKYNRECVSNVFYQGTSILNFKIFGCNDTFDLRKHLVGSLDANCGAFKVGLFSKSSFEHHEAQAAFNKGELNRFIKKNYKKLREYNELDVLSLAVLYYKFSRAIKDIDGFENYGGNEIHNYKTIGGLAWTRITEHWKKNKYDIRGFEGKVNGRHNEDLTTKNLEIYNTILKYKAGGRVQLFNLIIKVANAFSMDVASLYPYIMAIFPCYYPTGEMLYTDKYMDNKIGFYYCDIDQRILKEMNLPAIVCKKTKIRNEWSNYEPLQDYFISSPKIELLKRFEVTITIKGGVYWESDVKSCELFEPLLELMKIKNNQDELKRNQSSEYNAALRETVKLMSNSISGKTIEGMHLDQIEKIKHKDLIKYENKYECINVINIEDDMLTISYSKTEKECVKKSRPIHIGALIYDYSQIYMYEYIYSKISYKNLIYTDTDCCQMNKEGLAEWLPYAYKTMVPHFKEVEKWDAKYKTHKLYSPNSKVYGSFEEEFESDYASEVIKGIYLAKKCYMAKLENNEYKMTFKGVSERDILVYDIDTKPYILNNENKKVYLKGKKQEEINYLYSTTKNLKDGLEKEKLFDTLYDVGQAIILTQSFNRCVKNTCKNISIGGDYSEEKQIKNPTQLEY